MLQTEAVFLNRHKKTLGAGSGPHCVRTACNVALGTGTCRDANLALSAMHLASCRLLYRSRVRGHPFVIQTLKTSTSRHCSGISPLPARPIIIQENYSPGWTSYDVAVGGQRLEFIYSQAFSTCRTGSPIMLLTSYVFFSERRRKMEKINSCICCSFCQSVK